MAKQKTLSRPEKRVLSHQAVKRNRRSSSKSKRAKVVSSANHGYFRDIIAVFLFVASIGAFLALVSYHRVEASSAKIDNLIGPVGHGVASYLLGMLGVCGYLVPLAFLYTSLALFVRGRAKRRGRQVIGLIGLTLSGTVLAYLFLGNNSGLEYPPGGAVGAALGESLRSVLFTLGAVLVMLAVAAGALIIATDSAFSRLCVAIGSWTAHSAVSLGAFSLETSRQQIDAFRQRRIRRQKEKAEEDALFAQSLADAEEAEYCDEEENEPRKSTKKTKSPKVAGVSFLEDDEEQERVAEEAARLAREAEQSRIRKIAQEKEREAALRLAKKVRKTPVQDPAWVVDEEATAGVDSAHSSAISVTGQTKSIPPPVIAIPTYSEVRREMTRTSGDCTEADARAMTVEPASQSFGKGEGTGRADEKLDAAGLPLIVEPKALPKPSGQEKRDPFAFEQSANFTLPPVSLLQSVENKKRVLDKNTFFTTAEKLREKLASFGIDGIVKEIRPGPVVTMYEFEPAPGIKISKIANLADDLAMAMEAFKVRIVAPIPGKGVVGIEVPNRNRETVSFRDIIEQDSFSQSPSKITMAIGKNIEGMPFITDLAKMPHLLIAGTTGSGKSVSVNAMIMSILFKSTPEEVRMIMVDPKVTELSIYEGIPHLLLPVVTDAKKAALALRWGVEEMERRYQLLAEAGVRNLGGYNKWVEMQTANRAKEKAALAIASSPDAINGNGQNELDGESLKKLPFIVIIIDEVADLMMVASKEVETYVARLAQMARAAGIHLMIATQRPSTDVITGVIKANFPARISFQLRSKPDSMTILGTVGAEALLGMGDMLILPPTSAHLERVHGAFVSDDEIQKVVTHLKAQGKPVYDESILRPREEEEGENHSSGQEQYNDEMYDQCLALVSEMTQISVSMLQRRLRLGYNRAARIIERMEREGIVGPANGSKPREVLIRPIGQTHRELNF